MEDDVQKEGLGDTSLEVAPITSAYILLMTTQSYGHIELQGRLQNSPAV